MTTRAQQDPHQLGAEEVKLKNLADGKVFTAAAAQGHPRTARTPREIQRRHPAPRRRLRGFPGERDPKTGTLPASWSKCARATTEWVHLLPRRSRSPRLPRGKPRPQPLRRSRARAGRRRRSSPPRPSRKVAPKKKEEGPQPPRAASSSCTKPPPSQKLIAELGRRRASRSSTTPTATSRSSNSSKAKATKPSRTRFSPIPEILSKVLEIGKTGLASSASKASAK